MRLINLSKAKNKNKIIAISAIIGFIVVIVIGIIALSSLSGSKFSYEFDGDVAKGIDVSSHNGRVNWNEAKDDIDFAFVRAGYRGYGNGEINLDRQLKRNLRKTNEYSIPVGVYFYSQAITVEEAEEEAEFAINAVRHFDISLPIVIDFEFANLKNGALGGRLYDADLSRKDASKIINAFCERVEKAGYKSACYANTYFYNFVIDKKSLNKSICIWVADYNKELTYKGDFDIWQYSDKGKCSGVKSQYVDLNYWYKK